MQNNKSKQKQAEKETPTNWQRIEMVIQQSKMTANAFARHIGLPRGENLYQIKKGNNGISLDVATRICQHYPEIDKLDFPEAFFYCDPPYPLESRGSKHKGGDYLFDFTDADHERLAWKLHQIKGFAMVSGYDCLLMDYLYDDWHKIKFPMKRNNIRSNIVNGSGTLMQECIWCNYEIPVRNQNLFLHETAYSI